MKHIQPNAKQYAKLVKALTKAGFTAETVYPALEASKFIVELKSKTYKVYASRIIAMMHNETSETTALKL